MGKVSVALNDEKTEEILGAVGSPSIVLSELIKNSIDSNSKSVDIYIDTIKGEITVIDYGDGLDENNIKELGNIGVSNKKEYGKETREDGEYYSGSKGLGLLSAFSLSDYIEIITVNNDKAYLIQWEKSKGEFTYDEIKELPAYGTKLVIKNVSNDDINVLTDEDEYKKLRHVNICHFKNASKNFEKINFYIDDNLKDEFTCCDIKDINQDFVYKIKFDYYSQSNKLKLKFDEVNMTNSSKINKGNKLPIDRLLGSLIINLDNDLKINDFIKETYRINKTIYNKKLQFKYLSSNLESFEGMIYIIEGHKLSLNKKMLEKFGYGVKVFINNFAIYSYLDNDNDWLGFGQLSQVGKSTTLKPHNVFGYINFPKFNEKKSNLEIANERTNFIEKASYKKFIEIIKDIVVKITFEVDVAYRNDYIDTNNYLEGFFSNEDFDENVVTINDSPKQENGNDNIENKKDKQSNNKSDETLAPQKIKNKECNRDSKLESKTNDNKDNKDNNNLKHHNKDSKIQSPKEDNKNLDHKEKESKEIEDPSKLEIKNPAKSTIKLKGKPRFNFFTTSNVLKINGTISIEYNELIKQLKKISQVKELEYKDFYLIFVMAFRSILEDISKTYLNTRKLSLYGDFGQNIKAMTDDMSYVIRDTKLIEKKDREEIERIFGGFNAYKNFLKATGDDFYNNGQQGIKATKLNSFVHTPRWMDLEEAQSISNDIILPLIVASQEILKRIKK